MRCRFILLALPALAVALAATAPLRAQTPRPQVTESIDETKLVSLPGNTTPAAALKQNDRGPVADDLRLDHILILLKRDPQTEADLREHIDAMHNPASPDYHHWLIPEQLAARYGVHPQDLDAVQRWLTSRGLTINQTYKNGMVLDVSATAAQIRDTFRTEIHNLTLANGDHHIGNMRDPQIPAALAPVIAGVASLHDFFPRPRHTQPKPIAFDHNEKKWQPRFQVTIQNDAFNIVSPYDFATIYNVLPLWQQGFTGRGVTIALIEDTNLANPKDWTTFRKNFALDSFKSGNFTQVYPNCKNPGANSDEDEAALDVEWSSASAPDANIVLAACGDTKTVSGLDLATLGILEQPNPPDIISVSYGLCETISGQAEVALNDFEAQLATAEGTTFFIAQGDTGADECAPAEKPEYSILGINSGDNTASAYAVDIGGTDFMAQYNADVSKIPLTRYWADKNDPKTHASAKSYIPEIPWNDSCASRLIFTDPLIAGNYSQAFGEKGFCNSSVGQQFFLFDVAGGGGPSSCFTGTPSTPGVVSGTCKGNPKPSYQKGVEGVPHDGVRDQPDLSLFAADGVWGSFYPFCLSDTNQGGTTCTAENDAVLLGGGGTSFASPAMAGIQALINQRYGKQGNTNYVYYALAQQQFAHTASAARCDASQTSGNLPAASCVFNDITLGDIDIPCGKNPKTGDFYDCHGADKKIIGELSTSGDDDDPAYPATPGYDFATGLGSVNATNLFKSWPQPAAPTTTP
jgi:subtilase family serine protease